MSLSNTTLHGVVTARNLPQFGMSLVLLSKIALMSSLLNSMPPLMKLMVLMLKDIQLLFGTQEAIKPELHTKEKEILSHSKNTSPKMLILLRMPEQLNKRSFEKLSEHYFNQINLKRNDKFI